MNSIIRTGRIADIPEMLELLNDLFSIEEDFKFDREKQEAGLTMILESDSDKNILLVAESDSELIGMCSAQSLISTAEGARAAMVEDMVVKGEFRGKGIGKKILDEIIKWADSNKITRLQLLADKNNSMALSFYKQNNWENTSLICLRKKML